MQSGTRDDNKKIPATKRLDFLTRKNGGVEVPNGGEMWLSNNFDVKLLAVRRVISDPALRNE
jgi:hypothetical protein